MTVAEFRQQFTVFERDLFLNYAATCPLSARTVKGMQAATAKMQEPLGKHFYESLNDVEQCRRELAELIGASPKEIALAQNTSTAVSLIALGLKLGPGDQVLVPDNEFPSNFYAWQNLKTKGVECVPFTIAKGTSVVEAVTALDLSRVKLIALSAVSYETGRLHEISELVRLAHARSIRVFVDAIQAIGAVPVDVKEWGVDYLASGAQKWLLGPVGCGFVYVDQTQLESLEVPFVGWTSAQYPEYFDLKSWQFASDMTRFEPGLPNYLSILGCGLSLIQLRELGWNAVFEGVARNRSYLAAGLEGLGCELLTAASDRTAGIVSFRAPAIDHREVAEFYHRKGVTLTAREDYVRVSAHFMNTRAELDRFVQVTDELFREKSGGISKAQATRHSPTVGLSAAGVQPGEVKAAESERFLLIGATGNLGSAIARELVGAGHRLHLVAENEGELQALTRALESAATSGAKAGAIEYTALDLSNEGDVEGFCTRLAASAKATRDHGSAARALGGYAGLINCAGFVDPELFEGSEWSVLKKTWSVNLLAPARLMHAYLKCLAGPRTRGILNIVSSTGRCGTPLLSVYAASSAGLWTLGESVAREQANARNIPIVTYVAPAMHSPMQKRIGRVALRYFRMQGAFGYETAEVVAREALATYFERRRVRIAKASRLKIVANLLVPGLIDSKMAKSWRKP